MLGLPVDAQIRSVGAVPDDLKMSMEELYDSDIQRAKKYLGKRVRNKEEVQKTSYQINKMMSSGRILYGDAVSHMVGRIADTLLKDYPELRSELRFYTVNSPEVNAFATGQGMVFVNLGLVAQVEDEAQLAFILSHEIIHYYRAHAMEELVGQKKKRERAEVDDSDREVAEFLRRHNRSREMESEADSLGIRLFYLTSPYKKDVVDGVFDVLQYGALPFDDIPFDTTWFNNRSYRLTGCWLDTLTGITSRDNYDDRHSTHPNILSRRRSNNALMAGRHGGSRFVVTTQAEFEALRHQARLECIRQEIIHGQYARAFYNTWVLKQASTATDLNILNASEAYALYGMAMHKCHGTPVAEIDYKEIQGESQQVYYAMSTMTSEQAILIALNAVWREHLRNPGKEEYRLMADDLMEELRFSCKKDIADYLQQPVSTVAESVPDTTVSDDKPLSKYDRIKQKRKTQTEQSAEAYALTDLMLADSLLFPLLADHLNGLYVADTTSDTAGRNGILVFNPVSLVFSELNDEMKVGKSASTEHRLTRRVMGTAERLGYHNVDFSDDGLHQMVSDTQYNDFMTLCEWMNEFWLTKGGFRMQRMTQPAMNGLLDRYNACKVNLTALLNLENRRGEASVSSLIVIPLIPVTFIGMFTGIEQTAMASLVVDAREGKVLSSQTYNYNVADHNDLLDAMLYDTYARAMRGGEKLPKGFLGRQASIAGGVAWGSAGFQPMAEKHFSAFTPWLSLEYAIKRNISLTLWGRYHKGYDDLSHIATDYQYDASHNYVAVHDTSLCSSDMFTLGFMLRYYSRSDFAPLGLYFGAGLHWVNMQPYDNGEVQNTFGLHLALGRNYVFFDRLLFNYEVQYAYTYGLFRYVGLHDDDTYPYRHHADAAFANALTIRLGLGFLPF